MNKISRSILTMAMTTALLWCGAPKAAAQEKLTQDTLECHIVGFNIGLSAPDGKLSYAKDAQGNNHEWSTMKGLYEAPYLDFGFSGIYKYKSNWLVTLEGNMWIGNDNLRDRQEHLQGIYNSNGIVMALNGVDGVYTCYNRGLSVKAGLGKIFVVDKKNPNSGILAKISGGWMMQKTVFSQDINEAPCYQLAGNYLALYDHRRAGVMLTEAIGYWFMSNRLNLWNCYATFEVSQCWTRSTRDYVIDTYPTPDLRGPDNDRHFDLMYSIKLSWMFPLKGKTVYDYYY